jgi:hypothetical protein
MFTKCKRQASLPKYLKKATVDSMTTGQVAYTVPWGMWVDSARHCWLHPRYPIYNHPGGASQIRIELKEDGYHVWAPRGTTWSPSHESGFASPANTEYIPVTGLHR